MLIWYGCGPSSVLTIFFLLHHCEDACCIGKIVILHYLVQMFIGSWLVFERSLCLFRQIPLTIISKEYCMPAVRAMQIHTWELNQGPWDLQHSTLTTRLQQLVKVGCCNPIIDTMLLFCHPCSPAPPLLLHQVHWSLTITQKIFLALTQYAGPILSCENVTN